MLLNSLIQIKIKIKSRLFSISLFKILFDLFLQRVALESSEIEKDSKEFKNTLLHYFYAFFLDILRNFFEQIILKNIQSRD